MKICRFVASLLLVAIASFSLVSAADERREIMKFAEFGNPEPATREEVVRLLKAFTTSWATQDVNAHMALFSEDAEWINAYARMFRGTEELQVFLEQRLFPNWDAAVSKEEMDNATMVSIRYMGDDAAVIHMATDGQRGDSAISGEMMRRTHLHLVIEKHQQGWRIVHTVIMDARG